MLSSECNCHAKLARMNKSNTPKNSKKPSMDNSSSRSNHTKKTPLTEAERQQLLALQATWDDPEAKQEAKKYVKPIPSRALIIATLEKLGESQTHDMLAQHFQIADDEQYDALGHRLKAMLRDIQVKQVGSNPLTIAPLDKQDVLTAKVEAHAKGFGFAVLKDRPDLFLSAAEMRQVFHGDTVEVVASHSDKRGRHYGKIVNVVKRQQTKFIGKLAKDEEGFLLEMAAPNAHQPITLEDDDVKSFNAKQGQPLTVAVVDWPSLRELATGDIVHLMTDDTERDVFVQSTLLDHDIPHEFPDEVVEQAASYHEPNSDSLLKNPENARRDIRDLPLVTIDGEDARDFDDAVFAQKRAGGGFRLVVAIADVSNYVTPDSALDKEAWIRGTSVYFPQLVVPMLPQALSNGLCSLNPHLDRLCMVCDMNISRAGRVTGYEFYPAIMHSQARLTYTQVAQYMGDKKDKSHTPLITQNSGVKKSIDTLEQLMDVMLGVRKARNAMEFETTETFMTFKEDGSIDQILPRSRNDAHKLIEECMLLANVCAAEFALKHKLPVLYRNHESPEGDRSTRLRDYLSGLGISFPIDNVTQADYARVIEETRERPDAVNIHSMLLRSMMQAYYGPDNIGHFGLAYEHYGHFTSPIRRYPDLMLHRAIKAHVRNKPQPTDAETLEEAGEHLSSTERRAEEASRSVVGWLKCHYMQQHLGEEFEGVVSSVAEFGLFVTLTDLFVDGLVHISDLGDDYFEYDETYQALIGKAKGQAFALGDTVLIQVAGVNLEEQKIDFKLVKHVKSARNTLQPVFKAKTPINAKSGAKNKAKAKAQDAKKSEKRGGSKKANGPKRKPKSTSKNTKVKLNKSSKTKKSKKKAKKS